MADAPRSSGTETEPQIEYAVVKSLVNDDYFVTPRHLSMGYLQHCAMLSDRVELVKRLPKNARVAEIGTLRGVFARAIIEICAPVELHLFDLTFSHLPAAYFDPLVERGLVKLHKGDSSAMLRELPDQYFDWIYIDGDHSFDGVSRDIEVAKAKIKSDGFLVFNDYTTFSPLELIQYGVQRAINDLCLSEDFEIIYFALGDNGYHDVCLRRMRASRQSANGAGGETLRALLRSLLGWLRSKL